MNDLGSSQSQRRGFAGLPPVLKIAIWIGSVAALAGVVQGGAWLIGLDFQILSSAGGGRGVLLAMALATLFVMMGIDRRPLADYGLAVTSDWPRRWMPGWPAVQSSQSANPASLRQPMTTTSPTASLPASVS